MSTDVLLKFGKRPHMERLVNHGELFLNTLASYRAKEHCVERRDLNEGVERVIDMQGARLSKSGRDRAPPREIALINRGVGRVTNSSLDKMNVYCIFHLVLPDDQRVPLRDVIDERVWQGFGDTAVKIADAAEFVTRVKVVAKERGLEHWRKKVSYVDLQGRSQEVGPFVKDKSYSHQSELRIAIFDPNSEGGPLKLKIGALSDFATIIPASDIPALSIEVS